MSEPTTVTFDVPDMTCGNCVRHIGEALKGHAGLAEPVIDLASKRVTVTFDPGATSVAAIAAALDEEGYPASVVG